MASPFRLFRKHVKPLLVVFGVAIIFVFVIGDALTQYMRSASGGPEAGGAYGRRVVVVRWDGGKLTNEELSYLVRQRRIVNRFVQQVEYFGEMAVLEAGRQPGPLRVYRLALPDRTDQGVEQDVVRKQVIADAARKAGMQVTDEQIKHYLHELGRGNVSADHLRDIISRLQGGRGGVSVDLVLDALGEELLARNYLASHMFALHTVPPEQRWNDWLRANDRVVVEAAAISTPLFVVDVPEPTEAELTAFFDEFKQREPMPDNVGGIEMPSPTPGFAVPRKVELQFVRADYDTFMEHVSADVTDEEIEKFYEDNKDPYFIRADTGLFDAMFDDLTPDDATSDDAATAEVDAENEVDTGDANAETADVEAPDADSGTQLDEAMEEGVDDEAAPDEAAPDEAAPDEAAPDEAAPDESAAPDDGDQSSVDRPWQKQVFRLVAFADEADADETEADETEADETSADAALTNEAITASENGAGETADEKEAKEAEEAESAVDDADSSAPGSEPANTEPTEPTTETTEFQPLEEVRDQIVREIAQLKVSEQFETLLGRLEGELRAVHASYLIDVLDAEEDGKEPPPPPSELADLTALAQEHGLDYEKTGPLSVLELRDMPIGLSRRPSEETVPFLYAAFSKDLELYKPVATFDSNNNRYLVMKIGEVPGSVPTLDEIRDRVVDAWKRQQAAELGLKHAEEQAKKAEAAGLSLEEFYADNEDVKVSKIDLFSMLTIGAISRRTGQIQSFRLNKPEGIEGADFDVMETIFDLGDGEVAAALNHDHSIAYLLRVVERELTRAELQQAFLSEADRWYGLQVMNATHSRIAMQVLLNGMYEAAGVEWQRTPDQPYREGE